MVQCFGLMLRIAVMLRSNFYGVTLHVHTHLKLIRNKIFAVILKEFLRLLATWI